jgi:hypothetical protein
MNWILFVGSLLLIALMLVLIIRVSELSSSVKIFESFVSQCVTREDMDRYTENYDLRQ